MANGYSLTLSLASGVLVGQVLNAARPMSSIRSVTVGNSTNCAVAIWINGAVVPSSPPDILVPPNAYQTLPVGATRALAVNFVPPLGLVPAGSVYLHVSDETLSASGFQSSGGDASGAWDSSNWDNFNWG